MIIVYEIIVISKANYRFLANLLTYLIFNTQVGYFKSSPL